MIDPFDPALIAQSIREYKAEYTPVLITPVPPKPRYRMHNGPAAVRVGQKPRSLADQTAILNYGRKPWEEAKALKVLRIVADLSSNTIADLKTSTNEWRISHPRMVAWYVMHVKLGYSLQRIGHLFGRHHTSVMYGIKRAETAKGDSMETLRDAVLGKLQ